MCGDWWVRACVTLTWLSAAMAAQAVGVGPGQGVRFMQQSHAHAGGIDANTAIGTVAVDTYRLRDSFGLASGYVNVATSRGWVVRNLPVLAESTYPYLTVAADFDLGVNKGTALATLSAKVDYSVSPLLSYSVTPSDTYEVAPMTLSLGGVAAKPVLGAPSPPDLTSILFGNPTGNDTVIQFDHPNIESAKNACYPTAVANSLDFLRKTAGLPVPHEHKPGLKPSVSPGDNSLVGQLDETMDRQATDRRNGSGVFGGLAGKLKYLARNGLQSRVQVSHFGTFNDDNGAADVSVSEGGVTMKSTAKGAKVNFDTLLEAMRDGQNCEAVYAWGTGAHAVDLVGAGKTRGEPWLIHSSDLNQNSDSDGAGPTGLRFEYLNDPDNDGDLNLSGGSKELMFVVCEKALPPPVSLTSIETIDPGNHAPFVPRVPGAITVVIGPGRSITLSGTASWLPMSGTIDANGNVNASSLSTTAGRSNVRSEFAGVYNNGVLSGLFSVGTRGELQGTPISWRVRGVAPLEEPQLRMRMSGYLDRIELAADATVKPSITLKPGRLQGQTADWWLVAQTADGTLYSYDLASMSWKTGLSAVYTGALFDVSFFSLPSLRGLPSGSYDFYFGVDTVPNGILELDKTTYHKTRLTIGPS